MSVLQEVTEVLNLSRKSTKEIKTLLKEELNYRTPEHPSFYGEVTPSIVETALEMELWLRSDFANGRA